MHKVCNDHSFHLCNRSINEETNTKVASVLADADNYSHNENEISTAEYKMPNAKVVSLGAQAASLQRREAA